MNEKTLRTLIKADTPNYTVTATTIAGTIKTWSTLDTCAKFVLGLGLGLVQINLSRWTPDQRGLRL